MSYKSDSDEVIENAVRGDETSYFQTMKRRGYHSIDHVRFMISLFNSCPYKDECREDVMIMAIMYHDYCYKVPAEKGRNEEASAFAFGEIFNRSNKEGGAIGLLSVDKVKAIKELIVNSSDMSGSCLHCRYKETMLLHDLDYAILGVGNKAYTEYMLAVAYEYLGYYQIEDFIDGRIKFLSSMLAKDRIFFLPWFEPLENLAKENMRKEIRFWGERE